MLRQGEVSSSGFEKRHIINMIGQISAIDFDSIDLHKCLVCFHRGITQPYEIKHETRFGVLLR